ncbi:MAG: PspC domain-containing protein, partial [Chryseolinea sp.]
MKKNISINISGIIFHIEEDGYDNLRKYLDSINKYFASFEDSSEILADIESRVAEIFLSKLNEGKQVITSDDVNSLIATMGSVSDFKAAEDQEFSADPLASSPEEKGPNEEPKVAREEPKQRYQQHLYRDQKRKILGGVCSGIANYLGIDAIWIRLVFALLVFAYGLALLAYLVMWIVVPGSFDLEEPETVKKMFRDGERKVIAGVSGGVAAYFGMDIIAVRVLFVISTVFFGVGFVMYLVLWIALPEARSITDRMEMQGQPVTLSNIESNIKKNLNVDPEKEETAATKILLFPFRLIGLLLNALGKILGPLVELIRVAIGIVVVMTGTSLMLVAVISAGVFIGLFSASAFGGPYTDFAFPLEVFTNSFSGWLVFAGFLGTMVPATLITLLGASIIAKRYVFGTAVGWSLFVMFFVSVAILSISIPKIVYSFKEQGEYVMAENFPLNGKHTIMRVHEVGMDDYDGASLSLKGYDGKDLRLVKTFQSKGTTKQKAIENAQMVNYSVSQHDSTLTFDSNISFKENAVFRDQRLRMTLYVPYHHPFKLDESSARFISHYIDWDQLDDNTWEMTEKGLHCLTCPVSEEDRNKLTDEDLSDFKELEVRGIFDVKVRRGDEYRVEMIGSDTDKMKYKIFRSGEALIIEYKGQKNSKNFDWNSDAFNIDQIRINITMPNLEKIEAEGYGNINFENFDADDFDIEVRGPVKVKGELNVQDLVIDLTGKSEV